MAEENGIQNKISTQNFGQKATKFIGWTQVMFNGVVYVAASVILLNLLYLEDREKLKIAFFLGDQNYLIPPFYYDDMIFYFSLLGVNTLVAMCSGLILIKGANEGTVRLLRLWSFSILLTWTINFLILAQGSLFLALGFSSFYMSLCVCPYHIVQMYEGELALDQQLQKNLPLELVKNTNTPPVVDNVYVVVDEVSPVPNTPKKKDEQHLVQEKRYFGPYDFLLKA